MDILAADRSELNPGAFLRLWNACLGDAHPLEPALLAQHLAHPRFQPELLFLAHDGGELLGVAAGSAPELAWRPRELGYLSYLAVAPGARRRGLGGRLFERVRAGLLERGCSRLRLGADPNHLLPGMPAAVSPESWTFFLARGLAPSGVVHDLLLDLSRPLPERPLAGDLRLTERDPEGTLAFLARAFPGRWRDEAERYLRGGAPPLGLERSGEILGFACAFPPDGPVVGPGQHWRRALPGRVGGLGPIGIDEALRGRGQGLAFFIAAAAWLAARGADHIVVDWTDLTAFYGRAGARLWRSYQGLGGAL